MHSITFRLTMAFVTISLLAILLVAVFNGWITNREFERFILDQNRSGLLADLAAFYEINGTWDGVEQILPAPAPVDEFAPRQAPLTLADSSGYVIYAGQGYYSGEKLSPEALAVGMPVMVDGMRVGTVMVGKSTFQQNPMERDFKQRIRLLLVASALGTASLALMLGIFLSRKLTRPIRELTEATAAVSSGKYGEIVAVHSQDELGKLAESFNLMSKQLAHSMQLRRQMTADIAHELRTPLSLILGHVEAVHDGVLPPSSAAFEIVREEALRLESLVNDLRTLSLADAGELPLNRLPLDPLNFLEEVRNSFFQRFSQKTVTLDLLVVQPLPQVQLDPLRMMQVLGNILENALRHTPPGGRVVLSARQEKDTLSISVTDSGPGVAPDELERIFDRFYRSDPARQHTANSGSGLGLAIARSIVEQHGGSIHARNEQDGGLTVTLWFPL